MPSASALTTLPHTDGSATYSANGYTVLSSVYGPIEAARRDERPSECILEVHVRPAHGSGGVRERHLESLVKSTIKAVLITTEYPRGLVQITLQVLDGQKDKGQAESWVPILPVLLCAAELALVDAGLALRTRFASTIVVNYGEERMEGGPEVSDLEGMSSIHAVAFTTDGEMLLYESAGGFSLLGMKNVLALGKDVCLGLDESSNGVMSQLSSMMQDSITKKTKWTTSEG